MIGRNNNLAAYSEYLGLGIQIAASLLLPLLTGVWIDSRFETHPWFTIGGAFLGILSIFVIIFKVAIIANEKTKKDREKRQKRPK